MASTLASPPRSVPVPEYPPALDNAYSLGDLDSFMSDMHLRQSAHALSKAHSMDLCGLHLLRSPEAASHINQAAFCSSVPLADLARRSPSSAPVNGSRCWHTPNRGGPASRGKPRALFRDGELKDGPYSPSSPATRGRGPASARGGAAYRGGRGLTDPRRGQGHYRRLWAEVTKVGRGQKLGDGDSNFPDSSVEDMLQIVRGLAPDASAVAAVSEGLYYLDRCVSIPPITDVTSALQPAGTHGQSPHTS